MDMAEPKILSPEAIAGLSFEEAYAHLEQVVAVIEQGDLPLEQALALYEQGVLLAEHCAQKLEQAELRVSQWQGDGSLEPFDEWAQP